MRSVHDWLDDYARSHTHRSNRRLHFFCIPLIVFAVLAALYAVPVGNVWINPASCAAFAAVIYYARLSLPLALGAAAVFVIFLTCAGLLMRLTGPGYPWTVGILFAAGWLGQFIGHALEGARPSFFKDLQFLLIGPLWELAHLYRRLGLPIAPRG